MSFSRRNAVQHVDEDEGVGNMYPAYFDASVSAICGNELEVEWLQMFCEAILIMRCNGWVVHRSRVIWA